MKILITGAAGFIGTHLAKYCIDQGHEIYCIDNNWPYIHELMVLAMDPTKKVRINNLDISWRGFDDIFEEFKFDVCFHLAAYASEGRSNHIRSFIHQNNTVGTANVINACVNHNCKLVFTSSVAVYSGTPPFDESMTPNPIDEYGLSKYMSERSIMIAGDTQDLEYCIIRPRNVYGPGQNIFDRSRNLFGIWCYNALNGLPLTVYGDGSNKRTFTYIDDMIPYLYKAKDVNNEFINIGSFASYSIEDAVNIFVRVTGYNNVAHVEARHEVKEASCKIDKSFLLLGYGENLTTRLDDGLAKMWSWAQTVPMRELDKMPELETHINAHSSLK